MNKIERLQWIADTFGPKYVREYVVCYGSEHVATAARGFAFRWPADGWGIRTERPGATTAGIGNPLFLNLPPKRAWDVVVSCELMTWLNKVGHDWDFIITRGLPEVRCNAVAVPLDREHVFIEWNAVDTREIQRHMYRHAHHLRRAVFGPRGYTKWCGAWWPVRHPRDGSFYRFDEVYRLALSAGADEVTFSTAPDGRVVIW